MLHRAPVLVPAAALLLAGCLGASQGPVEPASLAPPLGDLLAGPLALDHDHADPALHALASPNLRPLSRTTWESLVLDAYPAQWFGEADVVGDRAFVAALVSGFAVVDIADPAAPRTLSYTAIPPVYVGDIKAALEGDLAILGTQRTVTRLTQALGLPPPPLPVGVPLATPVGAIGLQAWDTRDPAAPVLAGYLYVDGGCHMVSVAEQGSDTYVYCAPSDNTIRVFRLVVEDAPGARAVVFEPVATWSPGDLTEQVVYKVSPTQAQFTHDMTVQPDPLTGDLVMFVSFWDLGVFAVDVSDPASPEVLGVWDGKDALLWGGHLHTSMATLIDGTRVVVTVPEYADVPAVFVLDATDYGAMRLLGEWQPRSDGDYGESPSTFSTHNFQLVDGKLYMAMYHGGVWVLDLRDPRAPTPIAYFLPSGEGGGPAGPGPCGACVPDTWDVVVANGVVWAVDIPTGLYALHLDSDPLGDPAYDSFA